MANENRYYLDGMDMWTTWGIAPYAGSDDILKFPKRKPSITHDWMNSNGLDVDLSAMFFEAKTINLSCGIVVDDEAMFWRNYNAFLAQLAQPGVRRLYCVELEKSIFVYYEECTAFSRFTPIKAKDGIQRKIGCKFTIVLTQQDPDVNVDDRYIVDEEGRHIIT